MAIKNNLLKKSSDLCLDKIILNMEWLILHAYFDLKFN